MSVKAKQATATVETQEPKEKSTGQILADAATQGKGEVIEIDVTESQKCVGKYIVLFRKKVETVAFIESVENNEYMTYKIMQGPDKGKRFRARFFAKTLKVYDDETVTLALLK